jgi:hypothetical protein
MNIDGKIILKWILERKDWVCTGFIWLRIAEQLLASQEGLGSMELVMLWCFS